MFIVAACVPGLDQSHTVTVAEKIGQRLPFVSFHILKIIFSRILIHYLSSLPLNWRGLKPNAIACPCSTSVGCPVRLSQQQVALTDGVNTPAVRGLRGT